MAIKGSEDLKSYIKRKEGFRSQPYADANTGKMAVGYGDTDGPDTPVNEQEASRRLSDRVTLAEQELSPLIKRNLSQGQQDALLDMHYNLGLTNMRDGGFLDLVNNGTDEDIKKQMLRYTKAKNAKTGGMDDIPDLHNRVRDRVAMWESRSPVEQQKTSADFFSDLDSQMGASVEASQEQDPTFFSALDEAMIEAPLPEGAQKRAFDLEMASDISTGEEALRNNEARRLAEEVNIPFDQAQAELSERPREKILADNARALTAEFFPAAATWAQDPDNFHLMQQTGTWARKVEVAGRPLNKDKRSDWMKSLDANRLMIQEAMTYLDMAKGGRSVTDGKRLLVEIDKQRQAGVLTSEGAKRIQEVMQNPESGFWDYMKAFAKDPEAAAQMSLQSQGSTVATMFAAIAGAAAPTAVGFPLAAPATGAAAALAVSHLLAYSEYMTKQLEEFRDPRTGEIDIERAYSDPRRVAKWKREADVYGLTMGTADAALSLISGPLGEGVTKTVFKAPAKSAVGKVARVGVQFGTETALKAAEEGGSQLAANSGVRLMNGEFTLENLKKDIPEAVQEAAFSVIPGAAMTGVGMGTRHIIKTYKNAADKTVSEVKKASSANEAAADLSNLRARKTEEPRSAEHPQQTQSLIDTVVGPPPITEDMNSPVTDDIEAQVATERKSMQQESQGTVSVSPSEWMKYHELNGSDGLEAIGRFSPSVQAQFSKNRETDTSVVIPISEWLRFTEEDPGVDQIGRINDNELNAVEGNEVIEQVEAEPFTLFETQAQKPNIPSPPQMPKDKTPEAMKLYQREYADWEANKKEKERLYEEAVKRQRGFESMKGKGQQSSQDDSDLPPPVPGTTEQLNVQNAGDGVPAIKMSELTNRFRDEDGKKVYSKILSGLKRATKGSNVDQQSLDVISDLQYRHFLNRSEITGRPLTDIANRMKFGRMNKDGKSGEFTPAANIDAPFVIAFNKSSDSRTVIHELGHSWLQELSEDYDFIASIPEESLTPAQLEYKTAMDLAAEFFGLENIGVLRELPLEQQREIQERFAQTTENYFLEGKFADSRVRALMERLRTWLADIIRPAMEMFKRYPPLKINPKVERMYEAILGVSNRVEEEVVPMFPTPLFDPAMLGKDGQNYLKIVQDARMQATGEAFGKFFKQGEMSREREIDANLNRIFDESLAEVEAMPSMQVLQKFQEAYEAFKKDEGEDQRISFESLQRVLANGDEAMAEELRAAIPRVVVAGKKKGGIDATILMRALDINSAEELRDMLIEMGQKDALVQQTMERKIDTEFPVMKSDADIQEAAVEAVNDLGKEKLILAEVKILAQKYLPTLKGIAAKLITPAEYMNKVSKEAMENLAQTTVYESMAQRFGASKFLNDSNRHGRQAARMFKANNIEAAFDAKYRQAVAYFAYKTAVDAEKAMAASRARVKQFIKYARSKDHARIYDAEVMDYGRSVINAVVRNQDVPVFDPSSFSAYSGITQPMTEAVNDAIDNFRRSLNGKPSDAITVGSSIQLGEVLRLIQKTAKDAKKVELDGVKVERSVVAATVAAEINMNNNVVSFAGTGAPYYLRRAYVNARGLFASIYKNEVEFARSALGKLNGDIEQGQALANTQTDKYNKRITAALKKAIKGDSALASLLNPIITPLGLPAIDRKNSVIIPQDGEIQHTFNNEAEFLYAYAMVEGSESGAERFLMGGTDGNPLSGYDPITKRVDRTGWNKLRDRMIAEGKFTQAHFDAVRAIWDTMKEILPPLKDAIRREDGSEMGEITGSQVQTPWGTFEGAYVPIGSDDDLMSMLNVDIQDMNDPRVGVTKIMKLFPSMNKGMTKERSKMGRVSLNIGHLGSYISSTSRLIHLYGPLNNFSKIMSDPDVIKALEAKRPGAFKEIITPWFRAVKSQEYTQYGRHGQDSFFRFIRNNTNTAFYLLAPLNALKQQLGQFPALYQIGPMNLLKGNMRGMTSFRSAKAQILNNPVHAAMARRIQNSQQDLIRSGDELQSKYNWYTNSIEAGKVWGTFLSQASQNYVDMAVWHGAMAQAERNNLTPEEAARFAYDAVVATQGASTVSGMSNIQRGGDLWKIFTMATNFQVGLNNMGRVETMRDQTLVRKTALLMAVATVAVAVPSLVEFHLSDLLRVKPAGEEDKDPEELQAEKDKLINARMLTSGLEGLLPIWSRGVSLITAGLMGERAAPLSPLAGMADKVPRVAKAVKRKTKGIDMTYREYLDLMDTATAMTGWPVFSAWARAVSMREFFKDPEARLDEKLEHDLAVDDLRYEEEQ